MTDTKQTKLEKALELLTGRYQVKSAQLQDAQNTLKAINGDLSTETSADKWEGLVTQHALINDRISALVDELAVLGEKIRVVRLDINGYALAEVNSEISQLVSEATEIRLKLEGLHNNFRQAAASPRGDFDHRQSILDMKTEIGQLSLAGTLTKQQLDAAKRRRDDLTAAREAI